MPDAISAPLPGTIAYAEWKRKQVQAQKPGNQETGKLGSKEVVKEDGQEVILQGKSEDSQQVGNEVGQEARRQTSQPIKEREEEKPVFKASFLYTEEELEFFEDLKLEMRRKHGVKVTKNDLARFGIQLLAQDYRKNPEKSFVVKASQGRPKG